MKINAQPCIEIIRVCRGSRCDGWAFISWQYTNAIAEVAKKHRITQIVIGESQQQRWQIFLKGSLTQKLVRLLKNVDLHIISTEKNNLSSSVASYE